MISVIFLALSTLSIPLQAVIKAHPCYAIPKLMIRVLKLVYLSCFVTQLYLLLVIFFQRLFMLFSKTRFALSACTVRCYHSIWIAFPLFFVVMWTLFVAIPSVAHIARFTVIISMCGGLAVLTTMISLVLLYIYKLVQVYKSLQYEDHSFLVRIITKIAILTIASITVTLVDIIMLGIESWNKENVVISWLQTYVTLMDIYTNLLCVILSYKPFEPMYQVLCSTLDVMCNRCWTRLVASCTPVDVKMLQQTVKNVESNNVHHVGFHNTDSVPIPAEIV